MMEALKKFTCEKIAFAVASLHEKIIRETSAENIEKYTDSIVSLATAFKKVCETCTNNEKVGFDND